MNVCGHPIFIWRPLNSQRGNGVRRGSLLLIRRQSNQILIGGIVRGVGLGSEEEEGRGTGRRGTPG